MNLIRQSCGSGFCVHARVCVSVCEFVCLRVCVQAPLESINPKSNRLTAEAAFDVCWIPLWNIGCCFHNTPFPLSCQEYIVLFFPPHDADVVQQDRWLPCYEFVYNSGVFLVVLWSVILHLWASLIPFLSCVSLLIFDPNLKASHRMGQRRLTRVVFLTFKFNAYICQRELGGPPALGFSVLRAESERYLLLYISIYLCFIAAAWTWTQPILKPHAITL